MKILLHTFIGALLTLAGTVPVAAAERGLPAIVPADAQPEAIQGDFQFTEGPLGSPDGGLFFTTPPGMPSRMFRLETDGKITVFVENTQRANGLAYMRNGELIAVEAEGKRLVTFAKNGSLKELTRGDPATPLRAPNDLIADSKGGVYFTDPGPRPIVPGRKVHVHYLPPGSAHSIAVDDTMIRPNGLTLSLDERTLIVADTVAHDLIAFDVQPNGRLANRRAWARLRGIQEGEASAADGMAIDHAGRIFVATVTGVQVFEKTGEYIGTISVPRQPTNAAFSGPGKSTLFITTREGLYRIRTLTRGPERLGK